MDRRAYLTGCGIGASLLAGCFGIEPKFEVLDRNMVTGNAGQGYIKYDIKSKSDSEIHVQIRVELTDSNKPSGDIATGPRATVKINPGGETTVKVPTPDGKASGIYSYNDSLKTTTAPALNISSSHPQLSTSRPTQLHLSPLIHESADVNEISETGWRIIREHTVIDRSKEQDFNYTVARDGGPVIVEAYATDNLGNTGYMSQFFAVQ